MASKLPRLLYISRGGSIHDRNFFDAWGDAGFKVETFSLSDETIGELSQVIKEFSPSLVQAGPLCDVAPAVTKHWSGPLIATSWGFDLVSEIHQSKRAKNNCEFALKKAAVVLVDNNYTKQIALELGTLPSKLIQFPWGVNLKSFSFINNKFTFPENQKINILSLRNHEPIYNIELILRAFRLARRSTANLQLTIAGSGSLTEKYKSYVMKHSLSDSVKFVGVVKQNELSSLFHSSHLYVSASRVDGSSVSLLEAMASGLSVAVSDIPGNREWINDQTGQLFSLENEKTLAQIMRNLPENFSSDSTAKRLINARKIIEEKADWEQVPTILSNVAARLMLSTK